MSSQRLGIAAAAFAALLLIYLADLRRADRAADRAQEEKRVIVLTPEEIGAFSIETPAETMRCERRDGQWRLTAPFAARADAAAAFVH